MDIYPLEISVNICDSDIYSIKFLNAIFSVEERTGSRAGSVDSKGNGKPLSRPQSVTEQMFPEGGEDPRRSWTLDHVTEIVYLATQIQMTEQIEQALSDLEGGNNEALKVSYSHFHKSTLFIPTCNIMTKIVITAIRMERILS